MIQPPRPNRRAAMRGLTLALAAAASGLAFMGERAAHAAPAAPAAATSVQRMDPALDAIIPKDAKIEKVAGGFNFVEGPVWNKTELWFADLAGNKLYALGADGKKRLLLDHSGGPATSPSAYPGSNGMVVEKGGTVLMCRHGARDIVRVGPGMKITPFLSRNGEGKRFNSPNDLIYAPDGSLWITDPPYGLKGQDKDATKEAKYDAVYRYKDGKVTAVITDLPRPNGIGFSPDGKKLYVSNSEPEMFVNVYDVNADGTVSKGRRFISYPGPTPVDVPDGLKVDSRGNVWSSGPGGIRIISPAGKVLGQIKTPDRAQANLAWGGADRKTVYIMGAGNVYRLRISIPGEAPSYAR